MAVTKQLGGVFPSLFPGVVNTTTTTNHSSSNHNHHRSSSGSRSGAVKFESLYSEKLIELATKSNGTSVQPSTNINNNVVVVGPSSDNSGASFISPTSRGSSRGSNQQISPVTEICKEKCQRVDDETKFASPTRKCPHCEFTTSKSRKYHKHIMLHADRGEISVDEAGLPVEDAKEASGVENNDSSDDDELLLMPTMFSGQQRKDTDGVQERSESTVSDKDGLAIASMEDDDEEEATKDSKIDDLGRLRATSTAPSTVDGAVSPASQMQNLFGNERFFFDRFFKKCNVFLNVS